MFKRITAIVAIGAISAISLGAAAPAGAADPKLKSYGAGAYATALELTLLGQSIAVSTTSAAANSNPQAKADGAALLLAGTPLPGAAPSAAPEGPASNEACATELDLNEATGGALDLLGLDLACVETTATTNGGFPSAHSGSGEVVLTITAPGGEILSQLLEPLLAAVEDVTDPLIDALVPITDLVGDLTNIDLPVIVDDILTALQDDENRFVIAEIAIAPSASVAEASDANGVLAQAGAAGVTISLLPGLASSLEALGLGIPLVNEPLAVIKLGTAAAKVTRDPITGAADASGSAAQLLDIETNDILGLVDSLLGDVVSLTDALAVDALSCDPSNPLAGIVCIDLGRVNDLDAAELTARNLDFGEGTVGRESSAANIQVLGILSDVLGGSAVGISLGTATAAANAVPFVTPPTVGPRTLPKTGADISMPFALMLLAAAGATGVLVRRTRSTV